MADETKGEIVSDKEALATGHHAPGLWLKKIERAKKDEEKWHKQAKEAVQIYEADEGSDGTGVPAFNILHSNIEITVPSLYNSTPIPDIRRRFGDADPVAKMAVDIIERSLSYTVDTYDFDGHMLEGTRDAEIAGRGQIRIRYVPEMAEEQDETGATYETVKSQKVVCEHVCWDKWGHGPARSWEEVPWVYFEHDLTHDDLSDLGISGDRIKRLAFDDSDSNSESSGDRDKESTGVMKTVKAFEVWDKKSRKVYFVAAQDKDRYLSVQDDPLELEQFFPIPKPMMPLRRRSNLTPLVPYSMYKTQVSELDKVTKRINGLVGQLKVRGLYDKRLGADFERLRYADDGQYEPADDATMFASGAGGLEKAIAHWPMAEIVSALQQLYIQREQIKQVIYEVTGLSDVLRGSTDPNETLGAQQLKAQNGSTRLSQRQRMAADMSRDLFRMKAEIICNHFTPENLTMITGIPVNPQVMQLLQSDMMRSYKIDIESDSTVRADLQRSQEQMALFLQGTAQYASAMAPILMQEPSAKPAILQIYAAFSRHYKLGKSAEDALDQMVEAAQQPQQPKPDPEQQKLEMEKQRMQLQSQMDQQKMQMQQQADQEKRAGDMQKQQAELQIKMQIAEIDREAKMLDLEVARQKAQLELQKAQMELGLKRESMELDREAKIYDIETKREMSEVDIETRKQRAEADTQARHEKAEFEREQRQRKAAESGDSD